MSPPTTVFFFFLRRQSRLGVTEELHVIKFVMEFQHEGLEFNIEVSVCSIAEHINIRLGDGSVGSLLNGLLLLWVQASSLPLVVVSSTNQIPSAWASVMWSSMLSTGEPRVNLSSLCNTTHKQFTIRICLAASSGGE